MLKQRLLECGFEDGEALDAYVKLIKSNEGTPHKTFLTQQHHIIPRCYFKEQGLAVDNAEVNLVELSHADHLKAHYYLCLCAPPQLYRKLVLAFNYMRDKKHHYSRVEDLQLTEEEIMKFELLKKEKARLNSLQFSGKGNPNYGTGTNHWTKESSQKQSKAMTGRKFTQEHCQNISRAERGKKVSLEALQKMSEAWDYNKHVTPEIRMKRSLSAQNKHTRGQVYCVELQQIFPSAAEAARFLNRRYGGNYIRDCIKGIHEMAYGYHWEEVKV